MCFSAQFQLKKGQGIWHLMHTISTEARDPKHFFGTFLGTPFWAVTFRSCCKALFSALFHLRASALLSLPPDCVGVLEGGCLGMGLFVFSHSKPREGRKPREQQGENLKATPFWYNKSQYFEEPREPRKPRDEIFKDNPRSKQPFIGALIVSQILKIAGHSCAKEFAFLEGTVKGSSELKTGVHWIESHRTSPFQLTLLKWSLCVLNVRGLDSANLPDAIVQ